jgi:hypothetical protein
MRLPPQRIDLGGSARRTREAQIRIGRIVGRSPGRWLATRLDLIRDEALGLGPANRTVSAVATRVSSRIREDARRGQAPGLGARRAHVPRIRSRRVRLVTEHAFHVLVQADEPEGHVDLQLLGSHQIERLGGIERAAIRAYSRSRRSTPATGMSESRCYNFLRIDPA